MHANFCLLPFGMLLFLMADKHLLHDERGDSSIFKGRCRIITYIFLFFKTFIMDEFPSGYFYIKSRNSGKVIDGKFINNTSLFVTSYDTETSIL
jgi:hypothetical protein